jgi:thiamine-monophosphate kinase
MVAHGLIRAAMQEPTLHQLGEDAVVRRLLAQLPAASPHVKVAAGDDCAVLRVPGATRWLLLKTDVVVENVHFLASENPRRVGWKALCRALSDVAAMGGTPDSALVTLLAPPNTPMRRLDQLYSGIAKAARRFGVSVVGGETSHVEGRGPLICNIALTGWVRPKECILRSGGKPGDRLLVTGRLGGSLRTGKHLDFVPRVREAAWLVSRGGVHAMMDLSDGLGVDGARLAEASGCELEWSPESVPKTRGCTVQQAFEDGEDFELLLAVPPSKVASLLKAWARAFPKTPLTPVGALIEKKPRRVSLRGRRMSPATLSFGGYDHFQ